MNHNGNTETAPNQTEGLNTDLEVYIRAHYDRLSRGNIVFLLRGLSEGYTDLPDPQTDHYIYKATVENPNIDNYSGGIRVVEWPSFNKGPSSDKVRLDSFAVSPREVFLTREMLAVLKERTVLPPPRPARFNRVIDSRKGNFRRTLGTEMAKVVLERFQFDPKDKDGKLIVKK